MEKLHVTPDLTHQAHSYRQEILSSPSIRGRGMPGEGIEPPAFGLQNRCTTAVLTRRPSGQRDFSEVARLQGIWVLA
jgi:hypothetical protein